MSPLAQRYQRRLGGLQEALRDGNEKPLEVGHVFSVEPGIYVQGRFGVRYENIVHLGADGPEPMNLSPRKHFFNT